MESNYAHRLLEHKVSKALARQKSVLLFGPRQTGKTTLVSRLKSGFSVSLIQPDIRQKMEIMNPSPEQRV